MTSEIHEELAQAPHLIAVRGDERKQWLAEAAYRRGELERVLPGIYGAAGSVGMIARVSAAALSHPNLVLVGRAAAALSWWPGLPVPIVEAVSAHRLAPAPGYRWRRGVVPPELVLDRGRLRLSAPALTVLDLIPTMGGSAIDEALRRGAVTLPQLWEALALTPGRLGNPERHRLLKDSRDLPWSEAERGLHRLFRGLALPVAYATNHRVDLGGTTAYLDLALPELMLGFEVDGREHHTSPGAFLRDRTRDPELVERGWLIVRFAATSIQDDPGWVLERLRAIIAARIAERGER